MIITCNKIYEVYTDFYCGQGFRHEIDELESFDTRREAENYVKKWKQEHPDSWCDIYIREVLEF